MNNTQTEKNILKEIESWQKIHYEDDLLNDNRNLQIKYLCSKLEGYQLAQKENLDIKNVRSFNQETANKEIFEAGKREAQKETAEKVEKLRKEIKNILISNKIKSYICNFGEGWWGNVWKADSCKRGKDEKGERSKKK